ncbi:MAG: cardiolipin synthase [Planctomycetota bacterium]
MAEEMDVYLAALFPVLYLILEWTIRIAMIPVIVRKQGTGEALAWLALIFFQPVIGVIVYMIIGGSLLTNRRLEKHEEARALVETPQRLKVLEPHTACDTSISDRYRDLVQLAERVGAMVPTSGNGGELIADTDEFVRKLVDAIDKAEQHVHLLYYIWLDDTIGNTLADAVMRAAKRGVRCRVLVDDVGCKRMIRTIAPKLRGAGADVVRALPVRILRGQFARVDVRNHRKLAIIDGRTAFTGSHNACDPDYGSGGYGPWHDLTLRVFGPAVYQLQMVFCEDWASETGVIPEGDDVFPEPEPAGPVMVQTAPSGPGHRNEAFRDLLIASINEAEHRVIMTTPYFIPDESTLLALLLRARAGLQVDVVVPEKGNHPLLNAAAPAYYREVLDAGGNVLLHQNGLLHSKTLTVDDSIALVGSGNFDRRSFSLNYELNLLSIGKLETSQVRSFQEGYINDCRPLTMAELDERSAFKALVQNTAKLFSPLL